MRYDVIYEGKLFEDDVRVGHSNYYSVSESTWEKAIELYNWCASQGIDVELRDNEYSVNLYKGEWR